MGVAGLWDLIRLTSETRSLTQLAVIDGFEKNASGLRGYRLGIDASLWFFHLKNRHEGENTGLQLMFFRLAKLLSAPLLPLFVFDGPKRPAWKRGIQISRKPHWMIHGAKTMIHAFGFEWRQAPGEAEAELAYLNRVGAIDGILSDDVDTFLFGALTVIRNPGRGLTGNIKNPALNAKGKDDGNHVRIFKAADIATDEATGLDRAGFILIGLLSGGDYEEKEVPGSKLHGCGIATAHALARCSFGEGLVKTLDCIADDVLSAHLDRWRNTLRDELRTNSHGYLPHKQVKLADSVPDAFPNLSVLRAYAQPVTSESEAHLAGVSPPPVPQIEWQREHSLATLAQFCEEKFEWGTMQIIPKRFRSLLWHGSVIRILRRATLDLDHGKGSFQENCRVESTENVSRIDSCTSAIPRTLTEHHKQDLHTIGGTPSITISKHFADISACSSATSQCHPGNPDAMDVNIDDTHPLIVNILASTAAHPQTDSLLEYRIELDPYQLVLRTRAGIEGIRQEPVEASDGSVEEDEVDSNALKPDVVDPFSIHRIWVPACMLLPVEKQLVAAYEAKQETKSATLSRKSLSGGKQIATARGISTNVTPAKPRLKVHKVACTPTGVQLEKDGLPSEDIAGGFALAAVSDASDLDAGGNGARRQDNMSPVSKAARASDRRVRHRADTDLETNPNFTRNKRTKVASPVNSTSSSRHFPPARGQPETPHLSLLQKLDQDSVLADMLR